MYNLGWREYRLLSNTTVMDWHRVLPMAMDDQLGRGPTDHKIPDSVFFLNRTRDLIVETTVARVSGSRE